jgi:aminomethyltransferase
VTNDVSRIVIGQIQYSPMCYVDGGVVDDLLVYRMGEQEYFIVINAGNIAKDWAWMQEQASGFDVELTNLSAETAELALQGPLSQEILAKLTDAPLDSLKYYWFLPKVTVAGKETMVSRTGYTGEDGFEIYCKPEDAPAIWDALMEAGKPMGLQPAGLGCRDTLRFEACMPLYGHELSPQITPLEAGLGRFVALDKGNFNGSTTLVEQKSKGLSRKIVGLEMIGRGIARAEYPVVRDGETIGVVTTGTFAPTLNKNLGLALVKAEYTQIGQTFDIEIRGKNVQAQVIPKPFYKREGK